MNQTTKVIGITAIMALLIVGGAFALSRLRNEVGTSNTNANVAPIGTNTDGNTAAPSKGDAPLMITTMTHMEGAFRDDVDQNLFNRHVTDIRWAMDLFDEYGAKLTIETEQSFAEANINWGLNVLQEILDSGHGIGSHADFGYSPNDRNAESLEELTALYKELKTLVDSLVGAENNIGASGGIGQADWVIASAAAGYKFKDGVTGLGYLSMPESVRPEGWADEYIKEKGYHDPIPPEFEDRLYPLDLKDATDLVSDADGVITVMGGDIGELQSLAEGRINCFPNCPLEEDDVAEVVEAIELADRVRDRSRVARINIHIPAKAFTKNNETVLRAFLEAVDEYVGAGKIQWATQIESYQTYLEWK